MKACVYLSSVWTMDVQRSWKYTAQYACIMHVSLGIQMVICVYICIGAYPSINYWQHCSCLPPLFAVIICRRLHRHAYSQLCALHRQLFDLCVWTYVHVYMRACVFAVFVVIGTCIVLQLGYSPRLMVFECLATMFLFYAAHWQAYCSGLLKFGLWVSVSFSLLTFTNIH